MHKIAVFVEGMTEQLLIEKLLREIAGNLPLTIESRRASGGRKARRSIVQLSLRSTAAADEFFALIVDCSGDNKVASDIRDQYESLVQSGYRSIIGIRDVFPDFAYSDVPRLRTHLCFRQKTRPLAPLFVLGIMEVEAWFLAEYSHYSKLDRGLTIERIASEMGFDPRNDDLMLRPHPADDLNHIYRLCGMAYQKNKNSINRTVNLLDYSVIYLELGKKFPDLGNLFAAFDRFLNGYQS